MNQLRFEFILLISFFVFTTGYVFGASTIDQAKAELDTAIYHGKASADSDSLDTMKAHLHHVLNCIEGPEGKAFASSEANPCKGQGNGIIPDLTAAGSQGAQALGHVQEADKIAVSSAGVSDLHTLHGYVDDIVNHLEEASKALGM